MFYLHTPQLPPSLAQCLQYLQFLQALQLLLPVQVASVPALAAQQLWAISCPAAGLGLLLQAVSNRLSIRIGERILTLIAGFGFKGFKIGFSQDRYKPIFVPPSGDFQEYYQHFYPYIYQVFCESKEIRVWYFPRASFFFGQYGIPRNVLLCGRSAYSDCSFYRRCSGPSRYNRPLTDGQRDAAPGTRAGRRRYRAQDRCGRHTAVRTAAV